VGIVGMLVVGTLGAAMRTSGSLPARIVATAFAEFFRNTPPLVHIMFAYFALPVIGIRLPPFVAGSLALILYQGAIAIEILRAGLEAVPKGQHEAAGALGLSGVQQFRYIIAPQAFAISLPALGNNLIALLKNTSLVSAIGVLDITGAAMGVIAIRLSSTELFVAIGIFYLVAVTILSAILRVIENRLARFAA
jgi:His/Glu/Gln/Arg/opine family amino acid ABC transporter permease subunit